MNFGSHSLSLGSLRDTGSKDAPSHSPEPPARRRSLEDVLANGGSTTGFAMRRSGTADSGVHGGGSAPPPPKLQGPPPFKQPIHGTKFKELDEEYLKRRALLPTRSVQLGSGQEVCYIKDGGQGKQPVPVLALHGCCAGKYRWI